MSKFELYGDAQLPSGFVYPRVKVRAGSEPDASDRPIAALGITRSAVRIRLKTAPWKLGRAGAHTSERGASI